MNKLVSRNPILRFKEGRKILFAKWGDKAENPTPIIDPEETNEYHFGTWTGGNTIDGTKLIRDTELVREEDKRNPFYENYFFRRAPYSKISLGKILDKYYPVPLDRTNSYKATNSKPVIDKKHLPKSKQIVTNNIFIKGFQNRRGEIKDVRAMQNQLIKLGLLKDKFGADGKWGKNTEAAYLKYLLYLNNPSGISAPLTPAVEKDISPWEQMNTQENIPLYQKIKFKQGGQLPSRNIVERFKNGGVLKFQNAGNLPTAPKAEDRYKDSYKSWNWPQYKEVTAGSILFPGAKISLTIEGPDTTYMETPSRFPFVKVIPRVAKNNAKTIEWRDLITGLTYPEVRRGNSREYEILKRRFNTAWNLAK